MSDLIKSLSANAKDAGEGIAAIVALLGFLGLLARGFLGGRKQAAAEKPTEVAVVGSAAFDGNTIKDAMVTIKRVAEAAEICGGHLTAIAENQRAIFNLMTAREEREAEEEREMRIRADERDKIERERREEQDRDRRGGRRRPHAE